MSLYSGGQWTLAEAKLARSLCIGMNRRCQYFIPRLKQAFCYSIRAKKNKTKQTKEKKRKQKKTKQNKRKEKKTNQNKTKRKTLHGLIIIIIIQRRL